MKSVKKVVAKAAKTAAERALKRDANNTTCVAIYQPKIPTNLSQFKNKKR